MACWLSQLAARAALLRSPHLSSSHWASEEAGKGSGKAGGGGTGLQSVRAAGRLPGRPGGFLQLVFFLCKISPDFSTCVFLLFLLA